MKFLITTVVALATAAFAQNRAPEANSNFNSIYKPEPNITIDTGTTYTVEWTVPDAFKDVLINILYAGGTNSKDLQPRFNITRGIANSGSYEWEVPTEAGKWSYSGLIMESVEDPFNDYQYSNGFFVAGGPGASSSVSVSSAESTTTAPPTSSASSSAPTSSPASDSSSDSPTTTTTSSPSGTSDPATSQSSEEPNGSTQMKASGFAMVGMLMFAVTFLL